MSKMLNESGDCFVPALGAPGPLTARLMGLYKSGIDKISSKGRINDERQNK